MLFALLQSAMFIVNTTSEINEAFAIPQELYDSLHCVENHS